MCKVTGSYHTYSIPGKTGALVLVLPVEDLPSAELQIRFLHFQRRICPWTEHSDDDDDEPKLLKNHNFYFWKKKKLQKQGSGNPFDIPQFSNLFKLMGQ